MRAVLLHRRQSGRRSRPLENLHFAVAGQKPDELLHDWLAELLFTFETRHVLLCQFEVRVGGAA